MTTEQIIAHLVSQDISKIRTAACEIISFSQDKGRVLLLKDYRQLIKDKTAGLEMGGAFAPNKRFVEYALKIIDFHVTNSCCSCSLYSDYNYECNDPNNEVKKGNVSINGISRIENRWIDFYTCTCLKCGQNFKTFEREGHYMFWEWTKLDE